MSSTSYILIGLACGLFLGYSAGWLITSAHWKKMLYSVNRPKLIRDCGDLSPCSTCPDPSRCAMTGCERPSESSVSPKE